MKIAAYSRKNGVNDVDFLHHALWFMKIKGVQLVIHQNLNAENKLSVIIDGCESFETYQDLKEQSPIDFYFSFGGDGSFIDAANIIADLEIPLVGINTGRIGFLTSITKNSF